MPFFSYLYSRAWSSSWRARFLDFKNSKSPALKLKEHIFKQRQEKQKVKRQHWFKVAKFNRG